MFHLNIVRSGHDLSTAHAVSRGEIVSTVRGFLGDGFGMVTDGEVLLLDLGRDLLIQFGFVSLDLAV